MNDDWVDVTDAPLVADVVWLNEQDRLREVSQNGAHPDPEPSSWAPLNLAELEEQPPVEPTLGGLGFVYPGKRHVFSGPQESAKTLVAYIVLLKVIRDGGSAVLVDFEMGRYDARNRLRELGASPEELSRVAFVEPQEPATKPAVLALVALEPDIVVIDASAGAFVLESLDDNKRGDVEKFAQRYVDPFRRAGIATVVIDHVTKNVEARGNYAIGSERKVGQTDVHLGFTVVHPIKRGERGVYKVTTHKDRVGYLKRGKLGEFDLHSDPDTHALTWSFREAVEADEEHPFRPTGLMEKVSRFLERQVEKVSQRAVVDARLGKDAYVKDALQILVDEGYVERTEGPKRSLLHESIRAYREELDEAVPSEARVRPSEAQEFGESSEAVRPATKRDSLTDSLALDSVSEARGLGDLDDDIPF